jgi:hypothetical protein
LLVACAPGGQATADPLTVSPPWGASEEAHYVLYENEREVGRGILRVTAEGTSVRLEQHFRSPTATDTSIVVADSGSLKPQRSERTITGGSPTSARATYHDDTVSLSVTSEGTTRTREASIPGNAYDNDSSLFLWRALPLDEEYRTQYTSVVSLDGSRTVVVVRVLRRETVDTPAGRFEAWRMVIDAGRAHQTAWFTTDARRHLVRYDNGRTVFILQQLPS